MRIVDAQLHVWTEGQASAHHMQRGNPYTAECALADMDAAGVAAAVLAPPGWDPGGNAPSLEAARNYPDRFTVVGDIDGKAAPDPQRIRDWRAQPGMTGLRLNFNSPQKQAALTDGSLDWIWRAAEDVDLPIMLLIPGGLAQVEAIAGRFPGLRLCVDHLGIPRGAKDDAAFAHLPDLLALSGFPGVSVKAGGLPAYSTVDPWPYPSLHGHLRRVYDAFGPERIFWATDLTRLSSGYREAVTMITEGIAWLSDDDKRLIMGDALCRWLDWDPGHTD